LHNDFLELKFYLTIKYGEVLYKNKFFRKNKFSGEKNTFTVYIIPVKNKIRRKKR